MVVHINLYEDLLHYQSGIYYHREGARMGLHLLKIIGWSEQDGIPYWLCQNTWGESSHIYGIYYYNSLI
jgi:cathepsin B